MNSEIRLRGWNMWEDGFVDIETNKILYRGQIISSDKKLEGMKNVKQIFVMKLIKKSFSLMIPD